MSIVFKIFAECYNAIRKGELITKENKRDKEYHFQDWFKKRLGALGDHFDEPSRNTYPDFRMVNHSIGFETKGLQFPGREATYDCNSQVPTGIHNGREIIYVFGRYPKEPLNPHEYPVHDLIFCHGDFLNADHDYVHKNRSVKGFGSYGDIMIRDRKMYVAPTPYALTTGTENQITLIMPESATASNEFHQVGLLTRVETQKLIVGYNFNLQTNELTSDTTTNKTAGKKHTFIAYRLKQEPGPTVTMR